MENENVKKEIPEFLKEMLVTQYGEDIAKQIIEGYTAKRKVTLRVNNLKSNMENIKQKLDAEGIVYKNIEWYSEALSIENVREDKIKTLDIFENGEIYLQSLSSMMPPLAVAPQKGENILDMAAAPGGKTTQMASLSQNEAMITACEKNKIRSERLKYNLEKQGAKRVNVMVEDARNLSDYFSFDKILLDAPCSGSGTIYLQDEQTYKSFSKELIERSAKVQEQLLIKALKILKPGGELIYSTCSILAKENEDILNKVLSKSLNGDKNKDRNLNRGIDKVSDNAKVKFEIVPIEDEWAKCIPTLPVKIEGTVCVCPNESYEGFFVAKIRKCQ